MSVPNLGGEKWAQVTFKRETKSKNYFISNLGRAKSVDKVSGEEKLMKTHPDHRGFFRASIKAVSYTHLTLPTIYSV